jgi:hypothetical protein
VYCIKVTKKSKPGGVLGIFSILNDNTKKKKIILEKAEGTR